MEDNYRPLELIRILIGIKKSASKLSKIKDGDSFIPPKQTLRSDGTKRHPKPLGYKGVAHHYRRIQKELRG